MSIGGKPRDSERQNQKFKGSSPAIVSTPGDPAGFKKPGLKIDKENKRVLNMKNKPRERKKTFENDYKKPYYKKMKRSSSPIKPRKSA